jgi:TIR domain
MKAWSIDANTIDFDDLKTGQLNNYMVKTREIDDFLSSNTKKMFIVAPKGLGKTYLLKVKSQLLRESNSGFKFIPANTLCERFTNNEFSFSEKDLSKFNDINIWKKTWELCLFTLILKNFKSVDIPLEIANIIRHAGSLAEILGALLQNRGSITNLHKLVATDLKPSVRELRDDSSANQVAIFIDNIDEAFDNFVGYNSDKGSLLSASIWINAQLSILSVAKDICSTNRHIKIFLTIRSEAYNNNQDPQRLQLADLSVILKYNKEQIKRIFLQNIELSPNENLADPHNSNVLNRLCGYDVLKHKFVEDGLGNKIKENLFDFIYRHTFARPREIVLMGKRIIEIIEDLKDRKDSDIVGSVVNEVSYELFDQLKREIIPFFEDEIFDIFTQKVEHNVIRYSEAETIYKDVIKDYGFDNVFSYFYRIGLVGVVTNETNEKGGYLKQSFLPVGQYSLTEEKIPHCEFFIIHPSVNKRMKQIHDVGYYDKFNIIGYDGKFNPQMQRHLENHLHFGLDRDSLTIMLPELEHSKCVAVIVNPSPEWKDLDESDTFTIEINKTQISYKVYRDNLATDKKHEILDSWLNKRYSIIVYSTDIEEISKFYRNAITITVCLYTPYIDFLVRLVNNENHKKRYLYYCIREYIEKDFLIFNNHFQNTDDKVIIQPVVIDRYQFSQGIQYSSIDSLLMCTITSETYCQILCRDRPNSTIRNSENVIKISNDKTFSFYVLQKNLLVEGIYQFYKICIYNSNIVSTEKIKTMVDIFSEIQISRIYESIQMYDDDTYHAIFGGKNKGQIRIELKAKASSTLERVEKLFDIFGVFPNDSNIILNQERGIFPDENEFYNFTQSKISSYSQLDDFYLFYSVMKFSHLSKYRTVFISYSHKDSTKALIIEKRLTLKGLKVSLFEKDNPHQALDKYMKESVSENERMLFLSSQDSLKSQGCHVELSTCRNQMFANNDGYKLVAIRLDNYVLTVSESEVLDTERWKNIDMLKKRLFMCNYADFDVKDISELNSKIDTMVRDSFEKIS